MIPRRGRPRKKGVVMPSGHAHMDFHQLIGSLQSAASSAGVSAHSEAARRFVTISRQAGIPAHVVGKLLAEKLNDAHPSEQPWQCLGRELVQRIAAEHHLSADLIESLEKSSHTWISEFLRGLSLADQGTPSELAVLRRVIETVHALAKAGNVVLVGLGSALITRHLAGGLYAHIIAPFEWRAKATARDEQISESAARDRVKLLDRDRAAFFAKFWPQQPVNSEFFHLTLNASMLDEQQMADCLVPLVPQHAQQTT
jgi:cytidylate kinase